MLKCSGELSKERMFAFSETEDSNQFAAQYRNLAMKIPAMTPTDRLRAGNTVWWLLPACDVWAFNRLRTKPNVRLSQITLPSICSWIKALLVQIPPEYISLGNPSNESRWWLGTNGVLVHCSIYGSLGLELGSSLIWWHKITGKLFRR